MSSYQERLIPQETGSWLLSSAGFHWAGDVPSRNFLKRLVGPQGSNL
jgi:hypothetical protein